MHVMELTIGQVSITRQDKVLVMIDHIKPMLLHHFYNINHNKSVHMSNEPTAN